MGPAPPKGSRGPPRLPMPPRPGAGRTLPAQEGANLGRATPQVGGPALRWVVLHEPRSQAPLGGATPRPGSASALWRLSRDRWPVAQVPLAATQLIGAHRALVCGGESRPRLPEWALLAGHLFASVAATSPA